MDMKVTVKIKIAKGKEIVLDDAEARELYAALGKLYGMNPIVIEKVIRTFPEYDRPYWITYAGTTGECSFSVGDNITVCTEAAN